MTSCNTNWGRGLSNVSSMMTEAGIGMWLFLDILLVLWYQPTCSLITINLTSRFFLQVFVYEYEAMFLTQVQHLYTIHLIPACDSVWFLSIISLSRYKWQSFSFSSALISVHFEYRAEKSVRLVIFLFSAFSSLSFLICMNLYPHLFLWSLRWEKK